MGATNNVTIELKGLKLTLQLNISNLVVKMDALTSTNFISSRASINPLICECKKILEKISNKMIKYVFRKANKCVDFLANIRLQQQIPLSLWCSPHKGIILLWTWIPCSSGRNCRGS